jgi:hypothetical protein
MEATATEISPSLAPDVFHRPGLRLGSDDVLSVLALILEMHLPAAELGTNRPAPFGIESVQVKAFDEVPKKLQILTNTIDTGFLAFIDADCLFGILQVPLGSLGTAHAPGKPFWI